MNIKYMVIISAVLMAAGKVKTRIFFDTNKIANGEYTYRYYDGRYSKDETGELDNEGNSVVTGQYRYVVGNKEYVVTYSADKDGYHPKITILDDVRPPVYYYSPGVVASLVGK